MPLSRRFHRRLAVAVLAAFVSGAAAPSDAVAETVDGLYTGRVIVTGQDNIAERRRGTRLAFAEVLVKVTGDRRVANDPNVRALLDRAGDFVRRRDYLDRKKGIQISDEQGTRDRSFWLTVTFARRRVDRSLRALGREPWPADRPRLLVVLRIETSAGRFLVTEGSRLGYGQREAVRATSRKAGLPLSLPRQDDPALTATPQPDLTGAGLARLQAATRRAGAAGVLVGTMRVTPKGYWDTRWTLAVGATRGAWRLDGATFDRAIAFGVGEAARTLAARR